MQKRTGVFRRTVACGIALLGICLLTMEPQTWGETGGIRSAVAAELGGSDWKRMLFGESAILGAWESGAVGETQNPAPEKETGTAEVTEDTEDVIPEADVPKREIVEQTISPAASEGYANANGVYILNKTSKALDVAAMANAQIGLNLPWEGAQILIMHTHGTEAYTQAGTNVYSESDTARTTDTTQNMIRIGDEMARIFSEMGLRVVHDRELYDYPAYNGAYDRSKAAVERHLKENPSIQIVFDVHRDALVGADGTIYKPVKEIDGEKAAQVLMVMGSDEKGLSHPGWRENLTLAVQFQQRLNTIWPGLARPIALRSSRYNQQLTRGSVLVEVGSHGNTLEEALRGARCFARASGQVMQELRK